MYEISKELIKGISKAVIVLAIAFPLFLRADLEDVELELEDATQSSEAAIEEAEDSKKRLANEKAERNRAEKEAKNSVAKAKAKERDAKVEIKATLKKISEVNSKKEKYMKQKSTADNKFEKSVQEIAKIEAQLKKTEDETEVENNKKNESQEKLNAKLDELREIRAQLLKSKDNKANVKKELEGLRIEVRQTHTIAKKESAINAKKKAEINKTIRSLKKRIAKYQNQVKNNEQGIKTEGSKFEALKESVSIAENELEKVKTQAEDSSGKLADYNSSIKGEKSALRKRRSAANRDKKNIKNSRVRKVKRNCNVRTRPSGKSGAKGKVVKSKKYRVVSSGKYWYKFINGRFDGNFISKKCF